MVKYKAILCACAFLIFSGISLRAQDSKTFVHTIKQGETVFSIAQTYHVSTQEIFRLNPDALDCIKSVNTLIIPQNTSGTATGQRYHTVAAGETLYRLTKLYQVSAEDICKANPGLTADNFKTGMVVLIPRSSTQQATAKKTASAEPQKPKCKEMHKVQRRETLYSISKDYNITEAELIAANPEMKEPDYKLKRGSYICIPYPSPKPKAEVQAPTNKELICPPTVSAPQSLVRMGVILPFKKQYKESSRMIEFYRGALLAVENMKKSGLSVEVYAYNSGETAKELQQLLNTGKVPQLDFILGPLYPEQIETLSKYCQNKQIRLVVPFSSLGDEVYSTPRYFAVSPPKSFQQAEACELTLEIFKNQNFIFLDSKENDEDAASFTDELEKQLQQNGIRSKTVSLGSDEMAWLSALTRYKDNVIVPNSSSIKVLNTLFPKLKEIAKSYPEYRIKLLGYPEWQTYTNKHLENFYKFDTYAYSQFYRNPLQSQSSQFDQNYRNNFNQSPIASYPRFGMLGYDLTYYFLKGISAYGKGFENHLKDVKTQPYQHRFSFSRISNWSGFINKEMQFIHYTPSQSIELIRLKQ